MGNIALKLSCCSSKPLLRYDETSKPYEATRKKKDEVLRKNQEVSKTKKRKAEVFFHVIQVTIPEDIIIEILSWLPVKSFLKMKCVCKQWYALIQDRHFVEKHLSRGSPIKPFHNKYQNATPSGETFRLICGCDGLLLEKSNATKKYCIRNRNTFQRWDLPDPHKDCFDMTFSYIPSTGEYKLVCIFVKGNGSDEGWEVLTIGKDNLWRPLFPNLQCCGTKSQRPMVVSAGLAVHCISVIEFCSKFVAELVSFDVESETFSSVVLPHQMFSDWKKVWALNWNGFLSFATRLQENLNVVVLEDYKKVKWGKQKITILLSFMKNHDDSIEDLVPLAAQAGKLCFWLKTKKIIACNLDTMKISYTGAAAEGDNTRVQFYFGPLGLATLKGMQPYR